MIKTLALVLVLPASEVLAMGFAESFGAGAAASRAAGEQSRKQARVSCEATLRWPSGMPVKNRVSLPFLPGDDGLMGASGTLIDYGARRLTISVSVAPAREGRRPIMLRSAWTRVDTGEELGRLELPKSARTLDDFRILTGYASGEPVPAGAHALSAPISHIGLDCYIHDPR